MASLWNGIGNAERYYQCYINANLDKNFYPDGNNKVKYIKNEKNQYVKTKEILKENTALQLLTSSSNKNQAEIYKPGNNASWLVKCKIKNDSDVNFFWIPFSSLKKTEELKGADLKLNKGNIAEGIFFAAVMCLFTEQRNYFNVDNAKDIKNITVEQVKAFIKSEISPQYDKESKNKDKKMFIYHSEFKNIPNYGKSNVKDTVIGELVLNAVDGFHFINTSDPKIAPIFDSIIKDTISVVNSLYLKKFARAIYLNEQSDKIEISARGPLDAANDVKEDLTIAINGNPIKISLKNGSNQLGQFGVAAKTGEELFTKINNFFYKFFVINLPMELKKEFNSITMDIDKISEMSHIVMESVAKKLNTKTTIKRNLIHSFFVAMSGKDKDVVLFDIGHKLIKDISDYEKIINSCTKFTFKSSSDKESGDKSAHGQIDCYGIGSKIIPEVVGKNIHLFKIRFKITGTEKRIYFENGTSNSGNTVSVNKIIETFMNQK